MSFINDAPRDRDGIDAFVSDEVQMRIDRLCDEQRAAVVALKVAAASFKAAVEAIDLPLGCPVRGYDQASLTEICDDILGCSDEPDAERAQEIAEGEQL